MIRLAIFASGTGSNAANFASYFNDKSKGICVDCILTNKKNAGVISVAEQFSIPSYYFSNTAFEEAEEPLNLLRNRSVDWIVLAGFLRKIAPKLLNAYPNRIFNIHPSLLPKFGGKGMFGDHVHKAVIDSNETESGISIHLVNENFDEGTIVFQKSCSIESDETIESLKKKVQQLEQTYFPSVIENFILQANIGEKEIKEAFRP